LDSELLSNLFLYGSALASAFLVALWVSLIVWVYRDARQRVRDRFIPILSCLVVVILFLPGVFIYLILRPQHTLEEEYQQALEEEALLFSIEEAPICPGCSRKVQNNWIVCPSCHTQLRKPCPKCGRAVELPWDLCPYCSSALVQNITPANNPSQPESKETEKPIFL
jgi:hypothetical protein